MTFTKKQRKALKKARDYLAKSAVTLGHANLYHTEFYAILNDAYMKMISCKESRYVVK